MTQQLRLLARALKYRYKLDPAEITRMLRTVRPGHCALDLGAHKGAYAYWLSRAVGRSGRVVCVEAQRHLAERLERVMRPCPQVEVHWNAVSSQTGVGKLSLRPDGSSHGAALGGFADGQTGAVVEVPTISLADLVARARLPSLDFIKCDVEGHEIAVFEAGASVIDRFRPTMLVECEERHSAGGRAGVAALAAIFEPLGYRISFFRAGGLRPLAEFDPDRHQRYGHGEYCNNFFLEPQVPSTARC